MANFFTRALDKITPWRRGGEIQRDQEAYNRKKKKEEEERQRQQAFNNRNAQQTQVPYAPGQGPQPQKPVNIFEDLNKGLVLGQPKPGVVPVFNQNLQPPQTPKPGTVVQPTQPKPRTAEDDVNDGLNAGKSWEQISRETRVPLESVRKYSQATRPSYGTKMEKPKQSFGNRIRDVFDANTESDKFRRQQGNSGTRLQPGQTEKPIVLERPGNIVSRTPIVGHVAKTLNTGATQIAELPGTVGGFFASKEGSAAAEEYRNAVKSGDKARIAKAKQRVTDAVNREEDYNRQQEAGHEMFQKNHGGLFNTGTLYDEEASKRGDIKTGAKDILAPTAVTMLDLYTLGQGAAISEGLKQGGKAGLRVAAPNIVKATAGNYASGDINARSQGATNEEAIKSGLINSILGLVPDVGLPIIGRGLKNKIIPSIFRGRGVPLDEAARELDETAASVGAETTGQALRPKPIPVRGVQDIPIRVDEGLPEPVPVRTPPRPQPQLIKELEGDFSFPSYEKLNQIRVEGQRTAANEANAAARPDPFVEGITPRAPERPFALNPEEVLTGQAKVVEDYAAMLRDLGEGNGVDINRVTNTRSSNNYRPGMGSGRITKDQWLDEARRQLETGKAESGVQKAFDEAADPEVQALLAKGEQASLPEGSPIAVKQVTSIPVTDQTVVPTGLPETPGTVRVTEATAPNQAKSAAVAAQTPPSLPREVQEVLDNPKQFNKRQVAAARNQRKLARQMAKTQEDTAEAISRLEATKSPEVPQAEGYVPTGEFARGRRGAYQQTHAATEAAAGAEEMSMRSVDNLLEEVGAKDSFTAGDRRRITAALENVVKANPQDTETRMILRKLQSKSRTEVAQALAMIPKTVRKSANADTLVSRWESKVAKVLDNPSKMTEADFVRVQAANDKFTLARDTAAGLEEQFRRTGSEADFKAWEDAYKAARQADTDAKFTEASVAQRVLKGEKGAGVNKVLDDMKKEADVNTMDTITASMLSGTGTGFRNTFGTELAGIENRVGANLRAKVTKAIFGENVGGFSRKGAREGRKIGLVKLGKDASSRAAIGGKNPIEWAKNWSTTINSGGESSLQSQVYSRLAKYYKNQFAEEGLSGKSLDLRMRHAMLTDPDEMSNIFMDSAMKSSGLTGIFQKGQTIEKAVSDYIGRGTDSKTAQAAAKLAMRIMVGFPTATTNFLVQSGKRLSLGLPSFLESGAKAFISGDKKAAALAFDRGLKEAGSGASMFGLGVMLGSQGMVSGAYPDDPEERDRWKREGISENSIKIGNAWYPIPQGAGMLGLPIMFGAAVGREGDTDQSVKEMFDPKNLSSLLPTDQIQGFLNMASGNGAPQDLKNTIASATRAVTPAGSLWNQLAKSFDETKNDTSSKDFWANTFDAILSGNPVTNTMANIPDATDDAGNVLKNPNPAELAFGATSASQGAGVERSNQIEGEVDKSLQNLRDMGVTDDPNLKEVLDDKEKAIYDKLASGKKISPDDLKKLQEAYVKGVSSEGTDTAYLEREQYDTNLAVLKLKKQLMEADKTVKPSSIKDVETAIKRGAVYKNGKIPYDLISEYQGVGVEEWRKMGDPEEDEYDPDMYQKLWDIDNLMTKAGVSYKKGALDKNKYYTKDSKGKKGRGGAGSGVKQLDTSFGTLKEGRGAPRVQEYSSIDSKAGGIPIIRVVRPNIVHKIGSSG